jgi:hypothetical protein
MNPKHFHTPVSTRMRCPVCHQPVYSRGGIHPQCAMRQSEPPLPPADDSDETIAEADSTVALIVEKPTVIKPVAPKRKPVVFKA